MTQQRMYTNAVQKRKVQKLFIDSIVGTTKGFESIATVLIGATPSAYITLLRNMGAVMIIGYEKDKNTIIDISKNERDINIVRDDIFYASPTTFMDIDLVRTVKTENYLLKHLFEAQKYQVRGHKKVFMFTVALRQSSPTEVMSFLSEMLRQEVVSVDKKIDISEEKEPVIWKYNFITLDSSPYQIEAYSYKSDDKNGGNRGSRMMSVSIQYN